MKFIEWLENYHKLNLKTNKDEVLIAFELMEGSHTLKQKGDYSINGAIEWLEKNPEDGYYVIYGDGGFNRYFVYANGDIKFSEYHAIYPNKQTIQKAKDLGFETR